MHKTGARIGALQYVEALFYFLVIVAGKSADDQAQRPYHIHAYVRPADPFAGAAFEEERIVLAP